MKPPRTRDRDVLDWLLGRRELKARIEELETERDRLADRLEAESDRRREAVRERQTAQERVNRLEDRIADLEGQLDAATAAEDEDRGPAEFRRTADLRGDRLGTVLTRLRSVEAGAEGALTAVLGTEGPLPDPLTDHFEDHAVLLERARPCVVYADDAGVVSVALRPPLLPAPEWRWADRFRVERSWFRPTGEHALALVRSDRFALGVYDGTERTHVEGFESDVMDAHSKGGFSQGRFERRREEQIDHHLEKCRAALEDCSVDPLIVVGQAPLIDEFDERAVRTTALDASGPPREALDSARRSFWTTRLFAI